MTLLWTSNDYQPEKPKPVDVEASLPAVNVDSGGPELLAATVLVVVEVLDVVLPDPKDNPKN